MLHPNQPSKIYRLETETGPLYFRGPSAVARYIGCSVTHVYALLTRKESTPQGLGRHRKYPDYKLTVVDSIPAGSTYWEPEQGSEASLQGGRHKIYRLETGTEVRYIQGRKAVQAYLGCTIRVFYAILQGLGRLQFKSVKLAVVDQAPDGVEVLTTESPSITAAMAEAGKKTKHHPEWLHVDKKRTRFRITLPNEVITIYGRKEVCKKLGIHSSGLDAMLSNPNAMHRKQPIKIERLSGDIRASNTYTVFIDGAKHVVEGLKAVGELLGCSPSFASGFRDNPRSYKGRDIRVVLGEAKRGRFDYEVTVDGVTKVVRGWVDTAQLIGCKYAGLHRFMDRERLFKGRRIRVRKVLTSSEQDETVEA